MYMEHRQVEFWHVLIGSSLRYFAFAGISYLVFYVWKKHFWMSHKIQKKLPKSNEVNNELTHSVITLLIFACVIYSLLFTPLRSYTKIYTDIRSYSLLYFFISLALVICLHDTYFYWTHRLMHWKKIFPFVHQVHHRSHNPTPLAAFSFHPIEAIVEIGILPLIAFTLPLHRGVIGIFSLYMIVMNVIGHLGFELFPKWFLKNKISRWFNTSTHHNMHHHYGGGNYSLYFNIWDRLLHTNHPDYEREFNTIVSIRDLKQTTIHDKADVR